MSSPVEMKQKERHHKEQMKTNQGSSRIAWAAVGISLLSIVVSVVLHYVE